MSLAFSISCSGASAMTMPLGIEARATGATGNLMELHGRAGDASCTVELGERGEHHGVDGYVDADAERIGTADDGQQALLRQALDQTIARQHASMVHADAASSRRLRILPKAVVPFAASLMASRCSLAGDAKIGDSDVPSQVRHHG